MMDLRLGDARKVLCDMESRTVDALVTDPPAGISFMGKQWDHDHGGRDGWVRAFAAIFREALRVLKPGAHGLVWALPRTSHWTATALEDAGFEIRDVGVHLFGTGFPKSLNVGDGRGTALKPAAEHWILVRKPLDGTVAANVLAHGTGALNIDGCRIAAPDITEAQFAPNAGARYVGVLNGGKVSEAEPRVTSATPSGRWPANLTLEHTDACELVGTREVKSDGHHPAQRGLGGFGTAGHAGQADLVERKSTVEAWDCSPDCPVALLDEQSGDRPGSHNQKPVDSDNSWFTGAGINNGIGYSDGGGASRFFATFKQENECPLCGSATAAGPTSPPSDSVDGSAGSPAAAARTPVQESDCPAPSMSATRNGSSRPSATPTEAMPLFASASSPASQLARHSRSDSPANDAEAAEPIDTTTTTASRSRSAGFAGGVTSPTMPTSAADGAGPPESVTRFLYTPKPDRSERDIGCEGLTPATGGEATARKDGSAGLQNPRAGAGRNGGARNIHPTVKPVDLMRWLCRLVAPKGGLVLDPFMGSGTTGVACAREGFRFIGIEREPAYMEIAMRRIHGDAPLFNQPKQTRLLP